jgi:hypothetical protein
MQLPAAAAVRAPPVPAAATHLAEPAAPPPPPKRWHLAVLHFDHEIVHIPQVLPLTRVCPRAADMVMQRNGLSVSIVFNGVYVQRIGLAASSNDVHAHIPASACSGLVDSGTYVTALVLHFNDSTPDAVFTVELDVSFYPDGRDALHRMIRCSAGCSIRSGIRQFDAVLASVEAFVQSYVHTRRAQYECAVTADDKSAQLFTPDPVFGVCVADILRLRPDLEPLFDYR